MIHYTARNGTTFHLDPDSTDVLVTSPDQDGSPIALDVEDLREFLEHLEEQPYFGQFEYPPDADIAAVGPD